MTGSPKVIAAAVGGLVLLFQLPAAQGQSVAPAVMKVAALASGSIGGVVQDERGAPIPGAMVSALGAKTAIAVTDRGGRFELRTLSPGPYLVRAHVTGYVGSRGQLVEVRASTRTASSIALRRANAITAPPTSTTKLPVLAAGVGSPVETVEAIESQTAAISDPDPVAPVADSSASPVDDDHSETAWRLRHLRRGILKDVTVPDALLAGGNDAPSGTNIFDPLGGRSGSSASSSGLAANLFAGVPFTGQVNLLTTGSFDSPRQLFTSDNFSRSIAYFSLAAPVGGQADWSMHGALTQGDISSWFIAGAYATRLPARHQYDLGLSYSTQRYDGGNTAALREVTDGSRNVGAVYGFDTFTLSPEVAVTVGTRVSRYDYLATSVLFSPRFEVTLSPTDHFRLNALVSSHALAPGAEEFLPPTDTGLWLPPQRTFSSIVEGRPLRPERTEHLAVEAERDFGGSTVALRAFRQGVDDQLVTMFGTGVNVPPAGTRPELGHYFVGNVGDINAAGWGAAFRTTLVSRVHGSVEYSMSQARWSGRRAGDGAYMMLVAPSVVRPRLDRLQDLSTSVETNVPETATRILVVYRLTTAAGLTSGPDRPTYDPRFDVQVHQSLPFMDFSTARWEMLLAVRNTFHEATADSSVYDELMVVRPPKRVVGGLTLRF
jgi:Carboxypeptidase regulatory-like domain/TonB dependent receptor